MTSHDGPKVPSPHSFTVANELLGGLGKKGDIFPKFTWLRRPFAQ